MKAYEDVIKFIALDWANRLGFVNSMFLALISFFPLYTSTQGSPWVVGVFICVLTLFVTMIFWVLSFPPGELVATKIPRFYNKNPSVVCNCVIIVTNLIIIALICLNNAQFLGYPPPNPVPTAAPTPMP